MVIAHALSHMINSAIDNGCHKTDDLMKHLAAPQAYAWLGVYRTAETDRKIVTSFRKTVTHFQALPMKDQP